MFLSLFSLKRIYALSRTIYNLKNTTPEKKKNCVALAIEIHQLLTVSFIDRREAREDIKYVAAAHPDSQNHQHSEINKLYFIFST